ncbi:DNA-dependent RNA polymerase auxiliary subunit epsilon family protein [Alkalihalobacillus sp. LMS6]|uniref:DNA-dependent RNA polymerase subunit epsilon n=1 Tax=Bacillaceae TaxID=186817 RepID=UPI000C07CC49|nr:MULTISPECIES: DNA-directed RNA polymerase subunit epsilon [Bacillaceae]UTR04915.1 DNA-dependent RNA polymerase auxiliary subunit epsilon family protein [Alkalihalobacillus sp. LMS6]
MIFKVFFQEDFSQAPVRERTESLYIEAESVSDVRAKLVDEPYNIEYITPLTGSFLEYEQQREDFKVVNA